MKKTLLLFLWAFIFTCSTSVNAQSTDPQRTIKGTIVDENKEPIIGANVTVKGTTIGTITDVDGSFQLNVPSNARSVTITYVGYQALELELVGRTDFNVNLQPKSQDLDEVVVIGYGVSSVKDVTGSLTSISSKDFNKGLIASPEQLIQGKAAGVQITSSTGEPGAGINISIRGNSSVRSGNHPLYVVDGVPLSGDDVSSGGSTAFGGSAPKNPLNFLNPDDIKDIVILKDASATAIYGSRGANGVVIITTKSGQGSGHQLEYSASFGISTVTKKYDVLNGREFLDALKGYGISTDELDGGTNTNWQDQIYRTAFSQNHNVSYGNGDKNGGYRVSLNHMSQEGIINNSEMQRSTIRVNGNRKYFNDKLKLETQLTVSDIQDKGVPIGKPGHDGDLLSAAIYMNPTEAVYNKNGEYNQPSSTQLNPVAMLAYSKDKTSTLRALLSLSAEYQITKDLSIKTIYGYDASKSERKNAHSPLLNARGIVNVGKAYINSVDRKNTVWENFINYNKTFDRLNLSGMLGYSYQYFERSTSSMAGSKFRFDDVNLMLNNFASAQSIIGATDKEKDELQSVFGRVNFGYNEKFLLTATLRADGSTKFGKNNKYGYFPSVALGYRLSEEAFVPELFSNLKLRLGWGVTGNQEIPHNLYSQRQRYGSATIDNNGNITQGTLGDVTFANPDLKWESTSQYNFGIDFGILNQRLSGTIDVYYKNTTDLLLQLSSAQPAPQAFYWSNLDADIVNKGIELSLSANIIENEDFNWTVSGNISYNENEVKNLNTTIETGDLSGQGISGVKIQRIKEGYPMYTYYMRKFKGFDENGISIYNADYPEYVDESPMPKYTAGLTNYFRYKDFDLSIFFTGQFGHKLYNNTANAFFYAGALTNGRNVTKNVVGNGESPLNTADPSTRFLEKGDFIRLQDVSFGYNIPVKKLSYISGLRLFVTAQNLFVITDYDGQDPEVNIDKGVNGVPSMGIDYIAYPRSRTFMAGFRVQF